MQVTETTQKPVTAEDVAALLENGDDKRWELLNGELLTVSPTNQVHTTLTTWIGYLLLDFIGDKDLGDVTGEAGGFYLDRETILAPDIAFIAIARLTEPTSEKLYYLAPDLVVEIISPGNSAEEMQEKMEAYFKYGTRMIWVIFPKTRAVYYYKSPKQVEVLYADDLLDGGDVLPGFQIPVSRLFARLRT